MIEKDIDIIRNAVHMAMPEIPVLQGRTAENMAELIERLGEMRRVLRAKLEDREQKLEMLRLALRAVL